MLPPLLPYCQRAQFASRLYSLALAHGRVWTPRAVAQPARVFKDAGWTGCPSASAGCASVFSPAVSGANSAAAPQQQAIDECLPPPQTTDSAARALLRLSSHVGVMPAVGSTPSPKRNPLPARLPWPGVRQAGGTQDPPHLPGHASRPSILLPLVAVPKHGCTPPITAPLPPVASAPTRANLFL